MTRKTTKIERESTMTKNVDKLAKAIEAKADADNAAKDAFMELWEDVGPLILDHLDPETIVDMREAFLGVKAADEAFLKTVSNH